MKANNLIKPNFRTLTAEKLADQITYYWLCPSCDAYALGAELEEGIPYTQQKKTENTEYRKF